MSRRSSSLNQIDSGLSREIGSNFDVVKKVAEKLAELEAVGSSELVTLSSMQLNALASMTGVDVVAGIANNVTAISGSALTALTYNEWLSILGVTEAAQLIQNLEVQASSLPAGSEASATLTGSQLVIGVPRGEDGVDGIDGLTPKITLSVDGNYNLIYDVDYVVESEITDITIEEW